MLLIKLQLMKYQGLKFIEVQERIIIIEDLSERGERFFPRALSRPEPESMKKIMDKFDY